MFERGHVPNGSPPAGDEVDMTKSEVDDDTSIYTNSLDCKVYPCTLDISGVQIASISG